jgi:hypothetical protein
MWQAIYDWLKSTVSCIGLAFDCAAFWAPLVDPIHRVLRCFVRDSQDWSDYWTSRVLEYVWHVLLGEPWKMPVPNLRRMFPTADLDANNEWPQVGAVQLDTGITPVLYPAESEQPIQLVVTQQDGAPTLWLPSQPLPYVEMPARLALAGGAAVGSDKAREADGYIDYIVSNYDALPKHVVFSRAVLEADYPDEVRVSFALLSQPIVRWCRCRWLWRHQSMVTKLPRLNPTAYEFAALVSPEFVISNDGSVVSKRPFGFRDMSLVMNMWKSTALSRWISDTPTPVSVTSGVRVCLLSSLACDACAFVPCLCLQRTSLRFLCCSTFVVSRDRIRARPREMYEELRSWLASSVRYAAVRIWL